MPSSGYRSVRPAKAFRDVPAAPVKKAKAVEVKVNKSSRGQPIPIIFMAPPMLPAEAATPTPVVPVTVAPMAPSMLAVSTTSGNGSQTPPLRPRSSSGRSTTTTTTTSNNRHRHHRSRRTSTSSTSSRESISSVASEPIYSATLSSLPPVVSSDIAQLMAIGAVKRASQLNSAHYPVLSHQVLVDTSVAKSSKNDPSAVVNSNTNSNMITSVNPDGCATCGHTNHATNDCYRTSTITCHRCHGMGHRARTCTQTLRVITDRRNIVVTREQRDDQWKSFAVRHVAAVNARDRKAPSLSSSSSPLKGNDEHFSTRSARSPVWSNGMIVV